MAELIRQLPAVVTLADSDKLPLEQADALRAVTVAQLRANFVAAVPASATGTAGSVTFGTTAPAMDGTASAGAAASVSRSDHVHASDTTKATVSSVAALAVTSANNSTSISTLGTQVASALTGLSLTAGTLTATRVGGTSPITIALPSSSGTGTATAGSSLITAVTSDFSVTSGTLALAQAVYGVGSSTGTSTSGTSTSGTQAAATASTFLTTSVLYGSIKATVLGTDPTNMTQIMFGADSDGGSNGSGGSYVCQTTGTYEMQASLLLAAPGTSGLTTAPAGTRCGFALLNAGGNYVTQYAYVQAKEATARVTFVLPIGSLPYTINLWGFADVAHTVSAGPVGLSSLVLIKRVF